MVDSNLIAWLPFGAAMIVCAELKKEHSRGGKRKEIIQTDDEEEAKKVGTSPSHILLFQASNHAALILS